MDSIPLKGLRLACRWCTEIELSDDRLQMGWIDKRLRQFGYLYSLVVQLQRMDNSIGRYDCGEHMIQLDLSQRAMLMLRSPIRSGKGMGMHDGCALLNMNVRKKRDAAVIGNKQQRQE